MNKQKYPGLFLKIAGILLALCLVSAHFTTGLYARYTTRAQGTDKARAAKFEVTAEVIEVVNEQATLTNNNLSRTYVATLTNNSEVAVAASIKLIFPKGVDAESAWVNGEAFALETQEGANTITNELVFNGPFYLAPKSDTAHNQMTVTMDIYFSGSSAFKLVSINNAMDPTADSANTDLSVATYQLPYNAVVTFVQVD